MKPGKKFISHLSLAAMLFMPFMTFAASEGNKESASIFSNPLFNTLLIIIAILAVMILVLSNSLSSLIASDFMKEKIKKHKEGTARTTSALLLIFLTAVSFHASAAEVAKPETVASIGGLEKSTFYFMVITIAVELLVLAILFNTFKKLLSVGEVAKVKVKAAKPVTNVILQKLTGTVAVEDEARIVIDHEYDGIRELDNDLPPWWKYGFYLTILVAVIYMFNYHVLFTSPLQAEEYKLSVKKAEAEVAEYMKTSANNVDETTVKLLTDANDLSVGKELFIANCAACHGRSGEGTVGPNLTDDYWLHGGSVKDVFKTIKYGWPDKGMKAWKEDFSPMQIAQLTSFLRTFKGTNPTNPKEKQGELYVESETPADSTMMKADTAKVLSQKLP